MHTRTTLLNASRFDASHFNAPFFNEPRLALLIDAENINARHLPELMTASAARGRTTVRRAYGNWTTSQLAPWKAVLEDNVIVPQQQFRYARSKNAADAALIMDAMELMHASGVRAAAGIHGLCIVSSDSDYTGLAARAREAGLVVYGFGEACAARAFVKACDEFVWLGQQAS